MLLQLSGAIKQVVAEGLETASAPKEGGRPARIAVFAGGAGSTNLAPRVTANLRESWQRVLKLHRIGIHCLHSRVRPGHSTAWVVV